jgi:hypothetical protein
LNLLILHRIPYSKIEYHRGIDHDEHRVTYFGTKSALDTLPHALRCESVERPGCASAFAEARQWLERSPRKFDRVISLSEYELLDAALVREWLNIPGPSLAQVELARDKVLMKTVVEQAGLRVPRFFPLDTFMSTGGEVYWMGRTVLKPHSGASSEEVVVFDTPREAFHAITTRQSGASRLDTGQSAVNDYEIEEFISGPILHFDGLVAQGQVVALTASRYVGTCLAYAAGQPLGSCHFPLSTADRTWVARALDAVRIKDGSFHLEAIEHQGDLVFLEVGNRVGGADVVATFELATGIHLPSEELRILLGSSIAVPPAQSTENRQWHGWFVFPGHHLGTSANPGIDYSAAFRGSPAVLRWNELGRHAPLSNHITYQAQEVPLAGVIATASAEQTCAWITAFFNSAKYRSVISPNAVEEAS